MDSPVNIVREDLTPSSIFRAIFKMFALQGLVRGGMYGLGYGAIFGASIGYGIGAFPGVLVGALIGVIVGLVMGLIGGCVVGGFSIWWGRRQGGVLSDRHTANRDGYRRGILPLSVVTTVLGSPFLFPLVVRAVYSQVWESGPLSMIFLDLVPSLIAGFAAYQAGWEIITWYEGNVGHPRNTVSDSLSQEGVWPPPPLRP